MYTTSPVPGRQKSVVVNNVLLSPPLPHLRVAKSNSVSSKTAVDLIRAEAAAGAHFACQLVSYLIIPL